MRGKWDTDRERKNGKRKEMNLKGGSIGRDRSCGKGEDRRILRKGHERIRENGNINYQVRGKV